METSKNNFPDGLGVHARTKKRPVSLGNMWLLKVQASICGKQISRQRVCGKLRDKNPKYEETHVGQLPKWSTNSCMKSLPVSDSVPEFPGA